MFGNKHGMANLRCCKPNRERLVRSIKTLGLVLEPIGDYWPRLMIVSIDRQDSAYRAASFEIHLTNNQNHF
jgi:hypothetical protein